MTLWEKTARLAWRLLVPWKLVCSFNFPRLHVLTTKFDQWRGQISQWNETLHYFARKLPPSIFSSNPCQPKLLGSDRTASDAKPSLCIFNRSPTLIVYFLTLLGSSCPCQRAYCTSVPPELDWKPAILHRVVFRYYCGNHKTLDCESFGPWYAMISASGFTPCFKQHYIMLPFMWWISISLLHSKSTSLKMCKDSSSADDDQHRDDRPVLPSIFQIFG